MRIQHKLFVSFLAAGISLVLLMFVAIQWSLTRGLVEFVNTKDRDSLTSFVAALERGYRREQSWQWIAGRQRTLHDLYKAQVIDKHPNFVPPTSGPEHQGVRRPGDERFAPPKAGPRPPEFEPRPAVAGIERRGPLPRNRPAQISLLDSDKQLVVGGQRYKVSDNWLNIEVDGKIVGYVVFPKRHGINDGYALELLEQQRIAYIIISLCLVALTVVVALPLASNLVRPIKALAAFMDRLAKGEYQQRLSLKRNDELGQLSRDANELAATLEEAESARKRWLADISHELRTPIAVMKGEMEAVIDGVRPLDIAQVQSSYQETLRLQRLVEDLYELASNDIGALKYRKEEIDLAELLSDDLTQYQHILSAASLTLHSKLGDDSVMVWADGDRLTQLMVNLMSNCAKYAKDGSAVWLTLEAQDSHVQITVADDGHGVADEHLPQLFEHLYRVEDSRNRKTGGSGLGLAICKKIVEGHGGAIVATKAEQGGLQVRIELPIAGFLNH